MISTETARRNLDRRLAGLKPLVESARPSRGWIRAIRDALGITSLQMARRMGVSQPRVFAMEEAEKRGAVSLSTLSKAAEALDCTLIYALVPNESLDELVHRQAESLARHRLISVAHSMLLEDQAVPSEDFEYQVQRLAKDLLQGSPHRVWDSE